MVKVGFLNAYTQLRIMSIMLTRSKVNKVISTFITANMLNAV